MPRVRPPRSDAGQLLLRGTALNAPSFLTKNVLGLREFTLDPITPPVVSGVRPSS